MKTIKVARFTDVLPPMSELDPACLGEARRMLRKSRARLPDKIIDAVNSLCTAQIDYARSRQSIGGEYANPDEIGLAEKRLREHLAEALDVSVAECDASHD